MKIKRIIYERMLSHCRNCLPYEACGILAGKEQVIEIYEITNTESSSVSYFMEPKELLRAMKDIRARNLDMLAIYHSHPTGRALPSQKDIELAIYKVYYIIVGMFPEVEVKNFMVENGQYYEVPFNIVEDAQGC